MKNELTTLNITNKALTNTLTVISDLTKKATANAWGIARQYNDIVKNKLWKDDFNSLDELATVLNTNKGSISKYSRAYVIAEKYNMLSTTTVGVITQYLTLSVAQLEEAIKLTDSTTTVSKAKEIVKDLKTLEKQEEAEAEAEAEEAEEAETEPTKTVKELYIGDYIKLGDKIIYIDNAIYEAITQLEK